MIKLVQLGVDLFDTSYCHLVTERSAAITFSLNISDDISNTDFELNLRQEKYELVFKVSLASLCDFILDMQMTLAQ